VLKFPDDFQADPGFVRGEVRSGDEVVMTCSAVVKRIVEKGS